MSADLSIVILGLSITSSWGNGHATTYRGLVRKLAARGHRILFLERNVPWYAAHRDCLAFKGARVALYRSVDDLKSRFTGEIRSADLVIVGSYVPPGVAVGEWVTRTARHATAFYDIDTPVTLAKLQRGDAEYLTPALIPRYHLYLLFVGGPTLRLLRDRYGSPAARPLYCSVDPSLYYPEPCRKRWDLGYLGTYSQDRQPPLARLMLDAAWRWKRGRFTVVGPMYPTTIYWPANVERADHLPPLKHRTFYNSQRFTLNITRAEMIRAGFSPSVRLFEAAACGTPIISDYWPGLETFFELGREVVVSHGAIETLRVIRDMPEEERSAIGERARQRVLSHHTAAHRAEQLERYVRETLDRLAPRGGGRLSAGCSAPGRGGKASPKRSRTKVVHAPRRNGVHSHFL